MRSWFMSAELQQDSRRPICVVVDTSVWRSELLLKTPLGVTLVYTLSRRGGVLGLPEVVESEIKRQIVDAGLESADKARGHLHILHTITDDPFLVTELPTADRFSEKVDERIIQLASILVREPFTLEQAKSALAMVNAKVPPNGEKNQQFKDSAIWQAVLALSVRYSTVLLTNDKAFFRDRDPQNGLAENLVEDCTKARTVVKGFYGIGPYLESLKGDEPKFDCERAKALIVAVAMPRLKRETERLQSVPTKLLDTSISAFPTENPNRLAIDYTLIFQVEPVSSGFPREWEDQRGIVHGSAYFLPADGNLTDNYIQRITIKSPGSLSSRSFQDYDGSFAFPRPLPWD
jgi:hypothetical protein